ncbi:MAM and LDL-receptor class A domain-containing protein 2 [Portunus trituberculatus]|uniref:MAM and LDL-receptor class A domain-containing protein 2 n=1 Tax=Portunus trituberculatus TaxID=210409 RepID=A0A5B7CL57_PORTR|nr:MAM and LDL-receptor class A domain-containing protein 2 [Portunus trituberculatus]
MRAERANMCPFPLPLLLALSVLWAAGAVVCDRHVPAEDSPTITTTTAAPLTLWHCGFQEDMCGLTKVDGLEGSWERVYTIDPVLESPGERAGLLSPALPSSDAPRCLTFYYYLDGAEPGQLTVLLREEEGAAAAEAVWTRGWPEGPQWKFAYIELHLNTSVSILFEGVRGGNFISDLRLDEIHLKEGSCDIIPPTDITERFRCDFEEDVCGFTLEDKQGKWIWTYYNDPDVNVTFPEQDHTYNTGYGKYLAVLLNSPKSGVVGRVQTHKFSLEQHQPQCFSFWYMHNGQSNKDSLSVYVKHGLDVFPSAIWKEKNAQHLSWLEANIPIPSGLMNFQVEWEAYQQSESQDGVIAIDDVKLSAQECPSIGSCTFEAGTCGWQNLFENVNVTEDTNDWLQGSGESHLNDAGPHTDHYNDTSGMFLYIDGMETGTAVLESQLLVPEQHSDFCFSFWFYIEGEADDKLAISVVADSGKEKEVWVAGVASGWAQGQVRVKATEFVFIEVAYQLYIRGTRTSDKSMIALDDFSFKKKIECPKKPETPVTEGPSSSSTPPSNVLWGCDFTSGTCGLNMTGEGDWAYYSPNTNLAVHDELRNVTVVLDKMCLSFFGLEGNEGRAALPHLEAHDGPSCLTFWYIIGSVNRGNISIMFTSGDGGLGKVVWARSEAAGNVWITADLSVPVDGSTLVEFVVVNGQQNEGVLGIDDIVVTGDTCNHIFPDFWWCDFEYPDLCLVSTDPGLNDWKWVSPLQDQDSSQTPHIPADHTYQTGYGHYMEAALVPSNTEGRVGSLRTPWIFQPQHNPMCVSFWYVHNGATNVDSLYVYANISGSLGHHLWQEKASYINTWLSASVPIAAGEERSVQVLWEAWQGKREDHSSMAVDDIKITMLPCHTLGTNKFFPFLAFHFQRK